MTAEPADDEEDYECCLAAYCVGPRDHLAPHCPLHYVILDAWNQRNPSHAQCGCHPR